MHFMGISIGILALVCTLILLFGVAGTRKILGWTFALIMLGSVALGAVVWAWPALQRIAAEADAYSHRPSSIIRRRRTARHRATNGAWPIKRRRARMSSTASTADKFASRT